MQRSTDRILTTHVGSLPRPSDLDAMLRAREAGQSSDQAEFPDFQPPEGSTLNTRRMVCIGPLAWKDRTAVQTDIENFQAVLQALTEGARLASARLWE